jgi:predicted transcriptional regulator
MVTEKRSITLDTNVIKKVGELARKEDRSFSNMIQRILQEYLKTMKTSRDG